MELNSVNLKPYKATYAMVMLANFSAIIASYLLVLYGFVILPPFYKTQTITTPIITLVVLASFWLVSYYNKQIKQLDHYTEFEERLLRHIKIYKARLLWLVISCMSSSFLYVLTGHKIFLYLAIFDFVIYLPSYPNKLVIQKELKQDDLIFL